MTIEYIGASPFTLDFFILLGEGLVLSIVLAIISILLFKPKESK